MHDPVLVCPKDKSPLIQNSGCYQCQNCRASYSYADGYVDFLGKLDFYSTDVIQRDLKTLLYEMNHLGYAAGLKHFYQLHPSIRPYVEDKRRGDWICHAISGSDSKFRCLDIGSGLGNISEFLSHIYREVYSLELVRERIEFQKLRYKNSGCTNIFLTRAIPLELPFPGDFFDLVVCNGIIEWIPNLDIISKPSIAQIGFLLEIRRVLSTNGCLYIGVENRNGFHRLLSAMDNKGLRYPMPVPKEYADISQFGHLGHPCTDSDTKEHNRRRAYHKSLWGYETLLNKSSFDFKSYWAIPSYNMPLYTGRLNDPTALKGYLRYLYENSPKLKKAISLIQKFDKSSIGFMISLLAPSFLFFCYKDHINPSIDEVIMQETSLDNFTTISRGHSIMYILFNDKARPSKVAHLKRYGYRSPITTAFRNKTKPESLSSRSESVIIEDWLSGRRLNVLNSAESNVALDWLTNFQNATSKGKMTRNDIDIEVAMLSRQISQVPGIDIKESEKYLDEYRSYIVTLDIQKTAEHGDFWPSNILYEPRSGTIIVTDWHYFHETGNPLYDFVFFLYNAMLEPGYSERDFLNNLNGSGKFGSVLDEFKPKLRSHFGADLDLNKLVPYVILRFISTKYLEKFKEGVESYDVVEQHKKFLTIFSEHKKQLS